MARTAEQPNSATTDRGELAAEHVRRLREGATQDDRDDQQPAGNGGRTGDLVVVDDEARLFAAGVTTAEVAEVKHSAVTCAADADIISHLDGLREQAMRNLRDGRPVEAVVVDQVLQQARAWAAVRGLNGDAQDGGGS